MPYSDLVDGCSWSPNYYSGRRNVTRITPHHTACVADAWTIASMFKPTSRQASCNYAIGNDGSLVCVVDESDTAWTSSSWDNDSQAITVEISDCNYDWDIGDAAIETYINLCVDLIQRYPSLGGEYNYTGDTDGNITFHRWFSATACPGPHLGSDSLQAYIQKEVNRRLEGGGRFGVPMECIMRPDGAGFLVYVSGTDIVPLSNPDQCVALDKVHDRCVGGDLPRIELGEEGAPWAWRFFQACGKEDLYNYLMYGTPMPEDRPKENQEPSSSQPAQSSLDIEKIANLFKELGEALAPKE